MLKTIVVAAIFSIVAVSSASAVPTSSPITGVSEPAIAELLLVQERRSAHRDGDFRGWNDGRRSYTPGRRYNRAPPGWQRYGNRRPEKWRRSRCVMVGPIWFCP